MCSIESNFVKKIKAKSKVEAQKRVELVEEELAAHRLENSRLSLTNQRLQEEVSEIVNS